VRVLFSQMSAVATRAVALSMWASNVVTLMRPLTDGGLIKRTVLASDRRSTVFSLTAKGKRIRRDIEARLEAIEDELLANFAVKERSVLRDLLVRLD